MAVELEAYNDESYEPHRDFVIGAYVAPALEWLKLEAPWRQTLSDAGLREFRARDCEQGDNEFRDRRDRRELQERFIGLIGSVDVVGFAVRIDLHAYEAFYERVKASLPREKHRYFEAYPKVFEMQLQFVLEFAADKHPTAERINFVFDEQDEFAGRAADLYAMHRTNPALAHRDRLGAMTHGVSSDLVPLQAADVLAYEVHRQFRDGTPAPDKVRWQSVRLSEGGRISIANLDEKEIAAWANLYPAD